MIANRSSGIQPEGRHVSSVQLGLLIILGFFFQKKFHFFLDHGTVVNGILEYQMQELSRRICVHACVCVRVRGDLVTNE